jgi:phosphatidylglycerophosphate synthase
MLCDHLKCLIDRPLTFLAKRTYISPDALTVTGLIVTIVAAVTLTQNLLLGGLLILIGGFFDLLDGAVAKEHNKLTDFGAFLDSVVDRYSDAFLFLGFTWYFFNIKSLTGIWMSLGSMVGALLISYTRARAEGMGKDCKVGIMERPERILLMAFGAITGWVETIMGIMLILTHATVIQRIYHVKRVMNK